MDQWTVPNGLPLVIWNTSLLRCLKAKRQNVIWEFEVLVQILIGDVIFVLTSYSFSGMLF
ncbi:MAG: hypothetical protein QME51_07575 [Planctomycetota bacterium]|nr:hypothetical protein [Planctomycetota bacterium]